jgi:hypothetical protein
MQCASATILVAFSTGMWMAGQRFIQHGDSKRRPTPISILESAVPCGDLALMGDDRTGVARRKAGSCPPAAFDEGSKELVDSLRSSFVGN